MKPTPYTWRDWLIMPLVWFGVWLAVVFLGALMVYAVHH